MEKVEDATTTLSALCIRQVSLLCSAATAHALRQTARIALYSESTTEWQMRRFQRFGLKDAIRCSHKEVVSVLKPNLNWKLTFRARVLRWVTTLDMCTFIHTEFNITPEDVLNCARCRILQNQCKKGNLEIIRYIHENIFLSKEHCDCAYFQIALRKACELSCADIAIYLIKWYQPRIERILQFDVNHESILDFAARTPSPLFEYLQQTFCFDDRCTGLLSVVTESKLQHRIKAIIDQCALFKMTVSLNYSLVETISNPYELYALSYFLDTIGYEYLSESTRSRFRFELFPDVPELFYYWIVEKLRVRDVEIWPRCLIIFACVGYVRTAAFFHKRYVRTADKVHINECFMTALQNASQRGHERYVEFLVEHCDRRDPGILSVIRCCVSKFLIRGQHTFARWLMSEFSGHLISHYDGILPSEMGPSGIRKKASESEIIKKALTVELLEGFNHYFPVQQIDKDSFFEYERANFPWPITMSAEFFEDHLYTFAENKRFDIIQSCIEKFDLSAKIVLMRTLEFAADYGELFFLQFLSSKYDFNKYPTYCCRPFGKSIKLNVLPVVNFFAQFKMYQENSNIFYLLSKVTSDRVLQCLLSAWTLSADQISRICVRAMWIGNTYCVSQLKRRFQITIRDVLQHFRDDEYVIWDGYRKFFLRYVELALDYFVSDTACAQKLLEFFADIRKNGYVVPDSYITRLHQIVMSFEISEGNRIATLENSKSVGFWIRSFTSPSSIMFVKTNSS